MALAFDFARITYTEGAPSFAFLRRAIIKGRPPGEEGVFGQ